MKKQLILLSLFASITFGMSACNSGQEKEKAQEAPKVEASVEKSEKGHVCNHKEGEKCTEECMKKHAAMEGTDGKMHACKHKEGEKCTGECMKKHAAMEASAENTEMAYICPMKCEGSASEEAGKCPVCKMALVKAESLDN